MSIINFSNRKAVFSSNSVNMSVLKVLNDFRTFSYKMAYIPGSYASLLDTKTEIVIPKFGKDQVILKLNFFFELCFRLKLLLKLTEIY